MAFKAILLALSSALLFPFKESKWCRRAGPDLRDLAKPVDKWSEHLVLRGDRRADVVRSAG